MFDIGFSELLLLMAIATVVIGPKNLPRLARAIGKGWAEFQATFNELKQEVLDEAEELREAVHAEKLKADIAAAAIPETETPPPVLPVHSSPQPLPRKAE